VQLHPETERDTMKIETLAVHAGYSPDPTTKSVAVPIYQTVAYAFDSAQHGADLFDLKVPGNIYTRIMNPTTDVLEKRLAALHGGVGALALASGQSAITYAIQTIAEAGDNIVASSTLYGGTYNLFAHTFPQFGIATRFADYRDPSSFAQHIDDRTKAIYIETIGNPLGNIADIVAGQTYPLSIFPQRGHGLCEDRADGRDAVRSLGEQNLCNVRRLHQAFRYGWNDTNQYGR
jgi:O-acetylhomoserine (thiol)-lyase